MLDFKAISEMNVEEFSNYASQLDTETICSNRDILNFINGFIMCRELCKYKLEIEQVNKIFYAHLLGHQTKNLEEMYKKN